MKKVVNVVLSLLIVFALIGCSSNSKQIQDEVVEVVNNNDNNEQSTIEETIVDDNNKQEETPINNKEETLDPSKYDYWVVFYDQYGNELQRTAEKYGTVPSFKGTLPEGFVSWNKDLNAITTSTYIKAICDTKIDNRIKYTITFDTQGKGTLSSLKVVKNSLITRPQDPNVDGYTISGWYKEPECTNEWNFNTDTVTKDITLYANWIRTGLFISGETEPYQELTLENCGADASQIKGLIGSHESTIAVLPNGITSIGDNAFFECNNLKSIVIPSSVTSINNSAFKYAGLESVVVPSGVATISTSAFSNCSNLESVTISDGVTIIDTKAFYYCTKLKSITIPSSVTSIGNDAFAFCYDLQSITIPSSVTSIGIGVCESCTSLTSATISNGVTSIGNKMFSCCTKLISVDIPTSVTLIDSEAFALCTDLESINIPSGVTSIGEAVFCGCSKLTSITFNGTKEEWNVVAKGSYWKDGIAATSVACIDGDVDL